MNEMFQKYIEQTKNFWVTRTKRQRVTLIGSAVTAIVAIGLLIYFTTRVNLVPLYGDLTPSETGMIKERLDEEGIKSEITDGGQTILVPQELANSLKVELAAEGLPKSGTDYSFFSQNAGIGMTENEFNVLKLDATRTELANLIKEIDGIKDANVMLNVPEKGIFVSDTDEKATAAIMINTEPGYQFEENQIKALYHLVSKSLPNLSTEDIVILNQHFEYFDLDDASPGSAGTLYANQHGVKKQIERDLQRQVQSMLGTLMGQDKVVVSVTTDIDFTQENRQEDLVTPVDEENMEGITISAQRLSETYTGGDIDGGPPMGEDTADSLGTGTYLEGVTGSDGEYERIEETFNNEVNRIHKEIVESPYRIRDVGIQVMLEPPVADDPASFPQERLADIQEILGTIVRTSISKPSSEDDLTEEELANKIVVSVQPLEGKIDFTDGGTVPSSILTYGIGGLLLLILIIAILLFLRSRRQKQEMVEEASYLDETRPISVEDIGEEQETEGSLKMKQIEKMANDKPDEFAKLLRSWLSQE